MRFGSLDRRLRGLADEPPTEEDVTATPLVVSRGYVAVPTPDVQQFVRSQAVTFGAGFVLGMVAGAIFGNLLKGRTA